MKLRKFGNDTHCKVFDVDDVKRASVNTCAGYGHETREIYVDFHSPQSQLRVVERERKPLFDDLLEWIQARDWSELDTVQVSVQALRELISDIQASEVKDE